MAKGNANGAAVQYKVHLKPTDVGVRVIKRMERPHLDKSAELRRFIELGYAAEQAGFILDGTVLRHAGRMWDTQPDFSLNASNSVVQSPTTSAPRPADKESGDLAGNAPGAVAASADTIAAEAPSARGSGLRGNLRKLSG